MTRTRIKVCGITRLEDALVATKFGVDALGFVFYEKSPRYVSIEQAAIICQSVPPFVTKVALFVNADERKVREIIDSVHIDLLQFHGDESPAYCESFNMPYIKAIRAKNRENIIDEITAHRNAIGVLVDSYVPGIPGGTGNVFDWSLIPDEEKRKVVLAGGLNAGNVSQAINIVRPFAVDVSGGVEESKGIKNHEKIHQFIKEVASADEIY